MIEAGGAGCAVGRGVFQHQVQLAGTDIQVEAQGVRKLLHQPIAMAAQAALHLRLRQRGAGAEVHVLRAICAAMYLICYRFITGQSHHDVPARIVVHPDTRQPRRVPGFQALDQRPLLGGGDGVAGVLLAAAEKSAQLGDLGIDVGLTVAGGKR